MQAREDASYRIMLAESSLAVAREVLAIRQWAACVDHCQQAVENAAKAVLAMFGAPPPTHSPGKLLKEEIPPDAFPPSLAPAVDRLAQLSEDYGPDVHMQVRYGNERERILPRVLFGEPQAVDALAAADEALRLARDLLAALP